MRELTCVIAADDLTGANATAAMFSAEGFRAITLSHRDALDRARRDADVIVVDVGTRHADQAQAASAVRSVVRDADDALLVSKRIDTTLRGNIGAEVESAIQERRRMCEPARGLMVAAFPAGGRTTVGGYQLLNGQPLSFGHRQASLEPIHALYAETGLRVVNVGLDVVAAGGPRLLDRLSEAADLFICDATSDWHITQIARTAARVASESDVNWVPVDPGPLSLALYLEVLGPERIGRPPRVMAVAGSTTDLTREQFRVLTDAGLADIQTVDPQRDSTEDVVSSLRHALNQDSCPPVVGIMTVAPRHDAPADGAAVSRMLGEIAAATIASEEIDSLYLTGGETARAVLAATRAEGVEISGEILPLAVLGHLRGGDQSGMPLVTKGGLVGDRDAALRCINELLQLQRRAQTKGSE